MYGHQLSKYTFGFVRENIKFLREASELEAEFEFKFVVELEVRWKLRLRRSSNPSSGLWLS